MKLIIGLDACGINVVQQYRKQLKFFDWLLDKSAFGVLWAPIPWTGPSWGSIQTGVDMEVHKMDGHGKPIDVSPVPSIWELLAAGGLKVGILSFPMCLPHTRPVQKGFTENIRFCISGFYARFARYYGDMKDFYSLNFYRPPTLGQLLKEEGFVPDGACLLNPKKFDIKSDPLYVLKNSEAYTYFKSTYMDAEGRKLKVMERLLDLYPDIDVLGIGFTILDRMGHQIWPQISTHIETCTTWQREYSEQKEYLCKHITGETIMKAHLCEKCSLFADEIQETAVLDVYFALDELLLRLFNRIKPEELIICSDHGFCGYHHDNNHSKAGMFIYYAPGKVKPGYRVRDMYNVQILPTIFKAWGLDIPEHIKSKPKADIFMGSNPESGEADIIKERLKLLGYI